MGKIKGVFTKNFGRVRKWGEADQEKGFIYISNKCKGMKDLEIRLHEGLHVTCPYFTEEEVVAVSCDLARMLWISGYRKPDNDRFIPFQDEFSEEEIRSIIETKKHIREVRKLLSKMLDDLTTRAIDHDLSKQTEPELSFFTKYTPLLSGLVYGSEEYKKQLEELKNDESKN